MYVAYLYYCRPVIGDLQPGSDSLGQIFIQGHLKYSYDFLPSLLLMLHNDMGVP